MISSAVLFRIPVRFEIEPERIANLGGIDVASRRAGFERIVKQGLRAQLESGNLLTGQLIVQLDFHEGVPPAEIVYGGKYAAQAALEQAQKTLASASALVGPDSPVNSELRQALLELSDAARSVGLAADQIEQQPDSLIFGREEDK